MDIEDAIKLAKTQNKNVFVDTYAPWCVPCKRMDKVFREKKLANFFNEHFINVKINMDEPAGQQMNQVYNVIFLPTLLFINTDGYAVHRSEKEMSASELLRLGRIVEDPTLLGVNTSYELVEIAPSITKKEIIVEDSEPQYKPEDIVVTQQGKSSVQGNSKTEEKILYQLDGDSEMTPPEFLYHEAYFRMELMDGSHHKAAKAYLATQNDWSTAKNIRFIFDFLYSTESIEFQYLIDNRPLFDRTIGRESVTQSLAILIYNRLHTGFPRPDLEEAKNLYGHLDDTMAEIQAYQYMLQRLYQEQKYDEYLLTADKYLTKINPNDDLVIHNWVRLKARELTTANDLERLIGKMRKLIKTHPRNFYYHYTLAELFYINRDKSGAEKESALAIKLALEANANVDAIQELIRKIQTL
jgi:thiol-disulfide isomerase/thioredoxin